MNSKFWNSLPRVKSEPMPASKLQLVFAVSCVWLAVLVVILAVTL